MTNLWLAGVWLGPHGQHHPLVCSQSSPFQCELDEVGTLSCPHGEASEDEDRWLKRRHEIVAHLLMETLVGFENEGWPRP